MSCPQASDTAPKLTQNMAQTYAKAASKASPSPSP